VRSARGTEIFVTLAFAAVISSAGLIQAFSELQQGDELRVLEVFHQAPTARNLHAYERGLEETSLVANTLRPWVQFVQFGLLADAGEKALVGRDGWLFYRPGVRYATERPAIVREGNTEDPLAAIVSFRDQLATRGIRLLVVVAPDKESIYPEKLSRRAEGPGVIVCPETRRLLDELQGSGIAVVDLFEEFRRAKQDQSPSDPVRYYLAQDSHWSPEGARRAAETVARRVVDEGWIKPGAVVYDERLAPVRRLGDVIRMLQVPPLERMITPEQVDCVQVVRRDTGALYRDDPESPVLVLGDSFLRIYEQDEPGSAGFTAHLARELRQPLTSIVNDGGASTLVRQELSRRPKLLANKTLVIWEFVERDIRYGTEGWQVVPLTTPRTDRR
jgi:hypothetical protein